jgi:hypothetical protein
MYGIIRGSSWIEKGHSYKKTEPGNSENEYDTTDHESQFDYFVKNNPDYSPDAVP